jgi:hypothetical protein
MRAPDHTLQRLREAYLKMAPFYRPGAPGDGMGSVDLTEEEVRDPDRLHAEATAYALAFRQEEDTRSFWIGVSDFGTNQAFLWTIEAARLLAGGNNKGALKLLKLAEGQIKEAIRRRGR